MRACGLCVGVPGIVDFWVGSELQWAFELLTDVPDSKTPSLPVQAKDKTHCVLQPRHARVIDFRTNPSDPANPLVSSANYVSVTFQTELACARVKFYGSDGNVRREELIALS